MGNKASQLSEELIAKPTAELRQGLPQVRAWLLKYSGPTEIAQGDSEGPVQEFDEAAELATDLSSKQESASKASLHAEIASVCPLPHSELDQSSTEVITKLVTEVHSSVLTQEANNTISKSINALIKGHLSLQHNQLCETRLTEETTATQEDLRTTCPLSAVPLLWLLSNQELLQGDAGKGLMGLIGQVCEGTEVGGLLKTDLKDAKSALLERVGQLLVLKSSRLPGLGPDIRGFTESFLDVLYHRKLCIMRKLNRISIRYSSSGPSVI